MMQEIGSVLCFHTIPPAAMLKLDMAYHLIILVLTGFYHREDSHSIWPVRMGS